VSWRWKIPMIEKLKRMWMINKIHFLNYIWNNLVCNLYTDSVARCA
jgi:hypothetical protein